MERKGRSKVIRYIVLVTYIIMVVANGLAESLPINGQTTGQISDKYSNLFAPAGYTFSIWGLIYFLLALYTLYQLPIWKNNKNSDLLDQIGIYFSISSIANAIWIIDWHYDLIGLSVLIMVLILLCLIHINEMILGATLSNREKVFVRLPFSIYFGWITIATIANVTTFLVSIGWNGFGISDTFWTILILIVGAAIGITVMIRNKDIAYGLVFVWAYIGILMKHISKSGFAGEYPAIISTVIGCLVLFSGTIIYLLITRNRK